MTRDRVKKELIAIRGWQCEICKRKKWLNKKIPLEIHHVKPPSELNEDLQLVCPNCHAQTDNYRGKGIRKTKIITDEEIKEKINSSDNIHQLLINLGLVPKGGNYRSIRKRIVSLGLTFKFEKLELGEIKCLFCGFVFIDEKNRKFCSTKCSNKYNCNNNFNKETKIKWPSTEYLEKKTSELGFCAVARELGVSDNAIRKRIKNHPTSSIGET